MLSPAPRTALGLGLFAAALLVVAPSPARAQDAGDISVNPFHHAMDSRGYLTVNASQVLGNKEFAFGLVTDWGYRLVALEGDGGTTFDINHIVTPTLLAAGGLKIGPAEPRVRRDDPVRRGRRRSRPRLRTAARRPTRNDDPTSACRARASATSACT
jgi:hypothetical protein